jgi:hypothetical protein
MQKLIESFLGKSDGSMPQFTTSDPFSSSSPIGFGAWVPASSLSVPFKHGEPSEALSQERLQL